ncbi:MAG: DUF5317 family protein [Chloroflexi bacterium]|nr:DUF5317 family protein [Chloroflexota bacterium]MBI2983897.1 DUF5317 family protein [Chloroflexota bacterium]
MLASGPVLGIVAGLALRGSLTRLADLRIRWWPFLALAVGLRLVAGGAGDLAAALYVLAFAGIVAVAAANTVVPGMFLIVGGAALNLTVVAANGGMPVDTVALAAAGARMPGDALHVPLTDATALAMLADRIPVALFRSVYSVGDVLLTAGGFWVPFAWMRRR